MTPFPHEGNRVEVFCTWGMEDNDGRVPTIDPVPLPVLAGPAQAPFGWILGVALAFWYGFGYVRWYRHVTPPPARRTALRWFGVHIALNYLGLVLILLVALPWNVPLNAWYNRQFALDRPIPSGCFDQVLTQVNEAFAHAQGATQALVLVGIASMIVAGVLGAVISTTYLRRSAATDEGQPLGA